MPAMAVTTDSRTGGLPARRAAGGRTRKEMLASIARDKHLYLMLAPFILYYIVFYYFPFRGLEIAFLNYKPLLGYSGSKWVGFANFVNYFTSPYFFRTLRNTVLINVYGLIYGFPVPIILALLFNEVRNKRFRTVSQTISYIPNFISSVVIAGLVVNFLSPSNGLVNILLGKLGIQPIYFMIKPQYFRTIFVAQGIWAGAGFGSIIYYSSLCSIDADLYEAAAIDGVGRFGQVIHISLPGISSTIAIMLIMNMGYLLSSSTEMIILLYQPSTYETGDVIGSYLYRVGMINANYSLSTAVGLFNGIISLLLVLASNTISKKVSNVGIF
jgi:putative aldouronate transport system permease protein